MKTNNIVRLLPKDFKVKSTGNTRLLLHTSVGVKGKLVTDEYIYILEFADISSVQLNSIPEISIDEFIEFINSFKTLGHSESNYFKPFQQVLVRNSAGDPWTPALFSHINMDLSRRPYVCVSGAFNYCIPYESNEHLANTK